MLRPFKGSPTYANVASTLALVVALSGTAVAVVTLSRNSVRSKHIVNGQVKQGDLADNAVTGAKAKNGSLSIVDVENVVARPSGNQDISTGDGDQASPVDYPMTNSTWTQAATESDFFTGTVRYTRPGASCGGATYFTVILYVDGELIGQARDRFPSSPPGTTETVAVLFQDAALPAPGSPDNRTLTVRAYDSCPNGGDNFIVHEVNASVIGFR